MLQQKLVSTNFDFPATVDFLSQPFKLLFSQALN